MSDKQDGTTEMYHHDTTTVTQRVEGNGSGYTVRVSILDPDKVPVIEEEGYRETSTLFVVMSGGRVWSDHNRHRLVRTMPGDDQWIHPHLTEIAATARKRHSWFQE